MLVFYFYDTLSENEPWGSRNKHNKGIFVRKVRNNAVLLNRHGVSMIIESVHLENIENIDNIA